MQPNYYTRPSLVRSKLEFACSIWSSDQNVYIYQIGNVQRQMVMFPNKGKKRQKGHQQLRFRAIH